MIKISKKKVILVTGVGVCLLLVFGIFVMKKIATDRYQYDAQYFTDPDASTFATGGTFNESRSAETVLGPMFGYSPLVLDVASCKAGKDGVYFGLGHTEFKVYGITGGVCKFAHGTEIEQPGYRGGLSHICNVPSSQKIELRVADGGIDFAPIDKYCRQL